MPQMTFSLGFPFFLSSNTPLLLLHRTYSDSFTQVIDFGLSLMAFTHKLETWNILLCIRKGNVARIEYKIYREWVPWEQSWIILFGFFSRVWATYYSMKFHSQSNRIHFVWLMFRKDRMIRYSAVWIFKNRLFSH